MLTAVCLAVRSGGVVMTVRPCSGGSRVVRVGARGGAPSSGGRRLQVPCLPPSSRSSSRPSSLGVVRAIGPPNGGSGLRNPRALWALFYSPKLQSSPMADRIGWRSRLDMIKWPRVLLLSLSPASRLRLAARVRRGCVAAKETWDRATAVMGGACTRGGRVTPWAWPC